MEGYHWFDASQSWPEPDDDAAFRLMRQFMQDAGPFRAAAVDISKSIAHCFSAEAIAAPLLRVLRTARKTAREGAG